MMSQILTLKVQTSGRLVVNLYLGVDRLLRTTLVARGQPVPPPLQITALVDTGASRTVVELEKLQSLGLAPEGETNLHTVSTGSTPLTLDLYTVELALAESVTGTLAPDLNVVAANDLSGLGVNALLGRDVLRHLIFTYDGPNGEFSIAIP